MGYYESPPIVQPSRGGEIISASITNAANSIAQGILNVGERRRQEEKERKLTLQKLQDRKNETDLYYNEKVSDWASKQSHTSDVVDKQMYNLVQNKITLAADSRIALLNETDPAKRQEYLKNIRNANTFLDSTATFAKSIAGQTATWRLDTKAIKVGEPGGHAVNGSTDEEILDNTAAVEILGGMDARYKDPNIEVQEDEQGDGVILHVTGKHEDGREFKVSINSKSFDKSEVEGDNGLLIPIESIDTFHTQAKEDIVDKKGNIYEGYLSPKRETVDLPSSGTSGGIGKDQYQIVNGQRLQSEAIKAAIKKKADITATGMIGADGPGRLRALLDYTLKQGVGFYDDKFKNITNPEEQKAILSNILTEKAFSEMTRSLEKTTENGQTVYWNPTADIKLKDKPSASSLKEEKEKPTTYLSEYYDNLISGYQPKQGEQISAGQTAYRTRAGLVENLNQLSGKTDKYITKEELEKMYANAPYKTGKHDTGLTIGEAINKGEIKGTVKDIVKKIYGDSYIYMKEGEGAYKPIKGYNVDNAVDRIKLALNNTADAGERKLLQGKIKDARLMDWVKKNPKKAGESDQSYAKRAGKSI